VKLERHRLCNIHSIHVSQYVNSASVFEAWLYRLRSPNMATISF